MTRFHGLLRALATAVALLAALPPVAPQAVAGVTISQPTVLLAEPSGESTPLADVPAGAAATIDGEPVGAWYPVTVDGLSGWVIGHALAVQKDPAAPEADAVDDFPAATPDSDAASATTVPEATAIDDGPATSVPAADPGPDVATPAITEPAPAATVPAAADAPPDPLAQDAVATKAAPSPTAEPAPIPTESATPPPAAASDATATPEPQPTEAPSATPAPDPTAAPSTATPTPEPTPAGLDLHGAATVTTDASLLEWAGPDAQLVFTVPTGSTVNLQGERANGYVHAEFFWMFGWIREDLLEPAAPVAEEAIPDSVAEEDVKTPKPGAGMARTTVDLSLRAGPSATEDVLTVVPADTRVELTGVMQNDFQRVMYQDLVGWLSNAYLELPNDPEPQVRPNGKPEYTERQIVNIIGKAADRYGQSRDEMLRVARCESNLDPYAVNPSGSYGLFQFIRSTWESTPFGDQDVFDPEANANAAGWMWQQGRRAEWVCQ